MYEVGGRERRDPISVEHMHRVPGLAPSAILLHDAAQVRAVSVESGRGAGPATSPFPLAARRAVPRQRAVYEPRRAMFLQAAPGAVLPDWAG